VSEPGTPLLEVRDLHTYFPTRTGVVKAVEGVSLHAEHLAALDVQRHPLHRLHHARARGEVGVQRSEEHTSELQSHA